MGRTKLEEGVGRVPIPAMTVAPRTKEVFEQAVRTFNSNGLFMDALMAALEGLVQPGAPAAKRKKPRTKKGAGNADQPGGRS